MHYGQQQELRPDDRGFNPGEASAHTSLRQKGPLGSSFAWPIAEAALH